MGMPVVAEATSQMDNDRKVVSEAGIQLVNDWIKSDDGIIKGAVLTQKEQKVKKDLDQLLVDRNFDELSELMYDIEVGAVEGLNKLDLEFYMSKMN